MPLLRALLLTASAIWIIVIGIVEWGRRHYPGLDAVEPKEVVQSRVSIVLAARDEAMVIGQTLMQLRNSGPIVSEIIVVDDRSTDSTSDQIAAVPDAHGRILQIRINSLPQGWMGKQYALWQGAKRASGDWILFLDADSLLNPGAIKHAVSYAEARQLDYLSIVPTLCIRGAGARAFLGFFGFAIAMSLRLVLANLPSRRLPGIGIGAFQMVRRSQYFSIGGHGAVRQNAADDVALAGRFKRMGCAIGIVMGGSFLTVHWYQNLPEVILGFEKNFYSLVDYRRSRLMGLFIVFAGLFFLPDLGMVMLRGPWWIINVLTIMMVWSEYWRLSQAAINMGFIAPWLFLLMPFLFWFVMVRSVWRTERQQGIYWRGTFYPLAMLRNQTQNPAGSNRGEGQ